MRRLFINDNVTSNWIIRLSISVALLLLINTCALAKLNVVFRYDDLSGDLPESRADDSYRGQVWQAEMDVFNQFKAHGFHYVVSIIPNPLAYGSNEHAASFDLDVEKVNYLAPAEANGIAEIALHGYRHANHAEQGHRQGEFRERSYCDQYKDMQAGLDVLKKCGFTDVITFVPPWHGWDSNTARALIDSDFKVLSTRAYYYTELAESLCFIPKTTSLENLELIIEEANLPKEGLIVVLFHPYDLVAETGATCLGQERLKQLLGRLSEHVDVDVVSFKDLYDDDSGQFTARRYKAATLARNMREFAMTVFPKRIISYDFEAALFPVRSVYRTEKASSISALSDLALSVAMLLAVAFATLPIGRKILKNVPRLSTSMRLSVILGGSFIIACCLYQQYDLMRKGYIPVIAWFFPMIMSIVLIGYFCRRPKRMLSQAEE